MNKQLIFRFLGTLFLVHGIQLLYFQSNISIMSVEEVSVFMSLFGGVLLILLSFNKLISYRTPILIYVAIRSGLGIFPGFIFFGIIIEEFKNSIDVLSPVLSIWPFFLFLVSFRVSISDLKGSSKIAFIKKIIIILSIIFALIFLFLWQLVGSIH